jgi:oligopeptide/dipeptide ABC transporter ATP-binding protein
MTLSSAGLTEVPLLEATDVRKHFPVRAGLFTGRTVRAVDGVSLTLHAGETFGLVGESGSGKSTFGACVAGLERPTSGQVSLEGQDVATLGRAKRRKATRWVQTVFQDPHSSLDPRWTVERSVTEPLRVHGVGRPADHRERVAELLEAVGLPGMVKTRYTYQLSGGQLQRVAIARALALGPKLLVCDEPLSALDVSVQARMVNLMLQLQDHLGVAYLFISHDLGAVRQMSHHVGVMYLGRLVEHAPRDEVFSRPLHPYTQALLSARPVADPPRERQRQRVVLAGEPPNPTAPPPGCSFHVRCPIAIERCTTDTPLLRLLGGNQWVACHRAPDESQITIGKNSIDTNQDND